MHTCEVFSEGWVGIARYRCTAKGGRCGKEQNTASYTRSLGGSFHEWYIIREDLCILLSHRIKDVGKSKSASFMSVPIDRKTSVIEPAFEYWAFTPTKKLAESGIVRIEFEEWATRKLNQ